MRPEGCRNVRGQRLDLRMRPCSYWKLWDQRLDRRMRPWGKWKILGQRLDWRMRPRGNLKICMRPGAMLKDETRRLLEDRRPNGYWGHEIRKYSSMRPGSYWNIWDKEATRWNETRRKLKYILYIRPGGYWRIRDQEQTWSCYTVD